MRRTTAFLIVIALGGLVGACAQTSDDPLPPPTKDGGVDTTPAIDTSIAEVDPDAPIDTGSGGEVSTCTPGDIQKEACGKCGKRIRSCGPSGWLAWKACEDEIADAECSVGETNTIDCGNCGKQKDTCDPVACTWVTGSCTGEGECAPGDKEKTAASCTVVGEVRERLCSDLCKFSPWSACKLPTGWSKLDPPPTSLGARKWAGGVWSGTEAYFWGGYNYSGYSKGDGASVNGAGSWTAMPAAPSPLSSGRYLHSWVYADTGTSKYIIAWGGVTSSSTATNTGALYDITTTPGKWGAATNTTGAPTARAGHASVWATTSTGYKEMIIWGGCTSVGFGGDSCTAYAADGASYDPAKNTWTPIPAPPTVTGFVGRWKHKMVWTGSEVVIFGGQGSSGYLNTGIRYDPIGKTWTTFGTPTFDGRISSYGSAEWTGKEMLVFGGYGNYLTSSYGRDDGGRYLPGGGWSTISKPGSELSGTRWGFATWWGGTKLYVWSGFTGTGTVSTGGASYDPTLDKWAATDDTDAPSPGRGFSTAVWTGKEAFVFGGAAQTYYYASTFYGDGYIYRPL